MKAIKKIIISILVLVLTALIFTLTLCLDLRNVITHGIIKEVIRQELSIISYNTGNDENERISDYYKTDNEEINKILESDEINDLVNKYLDITIDSIIDENKLDEITIEKDMIEYLENNKEVLEEKTGKEITPEIIEKTRNDFAEQGLDENIKESIRKTSKEITPSQKKILKSYKVVVSSKLKIAIIIGIIIDIILLFVFSQSTLNAFSNIFYSLLSSGLMLVIASFIVNFIIKLKVNIQVLDTSILIKHGSIEFIIGLVCFIIIKIINKKNKEDLNEISKSHS